MEPEQVKPAKRVLKLKKTAAVAEPEPEPAAVAAAEPAKKRALKVKKASPLPPPPTTNEACWDKETEIIESVRLYYAEREEPIPAAEVDFLMKMLEHMKTEDPAAPPQWAIDAQKAIEEREGADPYRDLGPMPSYGTKEFWAWCWKRKALKAKHEAAIIAAGGTLPVKKGKKAK